MITQMSERIKRFREEIGMNQHELAHKLGVSHTAVVVWENGRSDPSLINCISLADVFGISLDQLVGREFKPKEGDVNVYRNTDLDLSRDDYDRNRDMARSSDDPVPGRVSPRARWGRN